MDSSSSDTVEVAFKSIKNTTLDITYFMSSIISLGNKSNLLHLNMNSKNNVHSTFEYFFQYNKDLILFAKSKLIDLLELFNTANLAFNYEYLSWAFNFCCVDLVAIFRKVVDEPSSQVIGLSAVLTSSVISGFTGVYFERIVKYSDPEDLLIIQNIKLGGYLNFI